jgi:small subunit ribosomal protein S17
MRKYQGLVASYKDQHTAIVSVKRVFAHPLYKKYIKRDRRFACHVEDIKIKEGNLVEILEIKPMSKTKHFKIIKKLS